MICGAFQLSWYLREQISNFEKSEKETSILVRGDKFGMRPSLFGRVYGRQLLRLLQLLAT